MGGGGSGLHHDRTSAVRRQGFRESSSLVEELQEREGPFPQRV